VDREKGRGVNGENPIGGNPKEANLIDVINRRNQGETRNLETGDAKIRNLDAEGRKNHRDVGVTRR
jgi:hypothetical protein